jgi:hypothetical protein
MSVLALATLAGFLALAAVSIGAYLLVRPNRERLATPAALPARPSPAIDEAATPSRKALPTARAASVNRRRGSLPLGSYTGRIPVAAISLAPLGMMTCPSCRQHILIGAQACDFCGEEFQ